MYISFKCEIRYLGCKNIHVPEQHFVCGGVGISQNEDEIQKSEG